MQIDKEDTHSDDDADYNVHYFDAAEHHNFDTSIYDINKGQRHSPPFKPHLPCNVWHSLSDTDKQAWDQLTNAGKSSLLQHFTQHHPPAAPPNMNTPSPSTSNKPASS